MKREKKENFKPLPLLAESEMPEAPVSLATMEHSQTSMWRTMRPAFVECIPACQSACPTGSDVERWIRLLEAGKVEEAYEAAVIENPFPAITGRVCTHPCTGSCNRATLGGAVNIRSIERAVADMMGAALPPAAPFLKPSERSVAIIGAGPSGLACAYHLRRLGHRTVVMEMAEKAGGLLRYGIPSFRLPHEVIDREIERLLAMGVEIRTGKPVPDATHMQSLRQEYNAVYISIGAHRQKTMGLGEERIQGVIQGLAFLRDAAHGRAPKTGKRAVVVGGCNTAVEAARMALRLGSEVTIVFSGQREAMSALPDSIDAAIEEGVKIETLTEPVKILTAGGSVSALACRRLTESGPDESGLVHTLPADGPQTDIAADCIIAAPGERIDTSVIPSSLHVEGGTIKIDETGRTEWLNVFAGGDFAGGAHTVVDALAAGKRTAIAIDCLLRGEGAQSALERVGVEGRGPALMSRYVAWRSGQDPSGISMDAAVRSDRTVRLADLNCAYFAVSAPNPAPRRGTQERLEKDPFSEIEGPLTDHALKSELGRCLHCGRCTECDNCQIYCPDVAISKRPGGYDLDLGHCKGCGVCCSECPRSAIEMLAERTEG